MGEGEGGGRGRGGGEGKGRGGGEGRGRGGGRGRGREGGWRGGGEEKEEIECKTSGKLSHFLYSVYVVTIKWSVNVDIT